MKLLARFVAVTSLVLLFTPAVAETKTTARVAGIKGFLYYNSAGAWSKNVFDKDFIVHNMNIGEGSAEHPSNDLLFVIDIANPDGNRAQVTVHYEPSGGDTKAGNVHDRSHELAFDGKRHMLPILINGASDGVYTIAVGIVDYKGKKLGKVSKFKLEAGGSAL